MQVDYLRQAAMYLVAGSVYVVGIAAGTAIVLGRTFNRIVLRRS
jgi:hypothetical protein